MGALSRRSFLERGLTLTAGVLASPAPAAASETPLAPDRKGVLVDTTVCIGCRSCEWACKTAHGLPTPPPAAYEDRAPLAAPRRPDAGALTVVNRSSGDGAFVKAQCMHCDHPACASSCIVGAFTKRPDGAVVWDGDRCIGCRYCLVACPFQVPAFEYARALEPRVMKCDFCAERRDGGAALPACVERCPVGALTFGRRDDLLRAARERVRRDPARYDAHVYGETEAGGTAWLYLRGPSGQLGLPRLGDRPAPGVSESIQHGIFAYFVPPVALYGLLGLMMKLNEGGDKDG